MSICIRFAKEEDIKNIFAIQKDNIHMIISENMLMEDLKKDSYKYIVATENDIVIGYLVINFILDTADIISVAVKDSHKGKNICKNMLDYIIPFLKENNVTDIFLEVRESNTSAIRAYTKSNFEKISTRKNYYSSPTEDAVIMKMNI